MGTMTPASGGLHSGAARRTSSWSRLHPGWLFLVAAALSIGVFAIGRASSPPAPHLQPAVRPTRPVAAINPALAQL